MSVDEVVDEDVVAVRLGPHQPKPLQPTTVR
jgi:hypothetical protein